MKDRIINYMHQNGSITTFEAFTELGCSRLSEYIRQIRFEYNIKCEWITAQNKYGEKIRYKRFWIAE